MTGTDTGPIAPRSNQRKSAVKRPGAVEPSGSIICEEIDLPSTMMSFSPTTVNIVASVASRSGMRAKTMRAAFSAPISAPESSTTPTAMPPT